MPLEDTHPRLEAIIQEVKSREVTQYEGYVPRPDVLLVAEIERLRARLALADRLAEAVGNERRVAIRNWGYITDEVRDSKHKTEAALAAYRKEGE